MIKIIQYLEQNPSVVALIKEQKASLVGVTAIEQQAILESFNGETHVESTIWY